MKNLRPTAPNGGAPVPAFTPVPRKHARHDGWTPERQRAFIDALADTGSVKTAAERINMAAAGAYQLRRQPGAAEFARAWDVALDHGVQNLRDLAVDRVRDGVPVPVFWKGEQVGEKRKFNDRLLMFILRHHAEGGGLFGGAVARSLAEAQSEAKLRKNATALSTLLTAHRLLVRAAVKSMFAGDHQSAAAHESMAREFECTIDGDPAEWHGTAELSRITAQLVPAHDPRGMLDPEHPEHLPSLHEGPGPAPSLATQEWDEPTGTLIPKLPLHPMIHRGTSSIWCGPTLAARERARDAAAERIRLAQKEWLAAGCEADWARWQAEQ